MAMHLIFLKALGAGERWITVRAPGHDKGQPLLIKEQPDGSSKVLGGAGGSMNHLRLTGVRSEADYKGEIASRVKLKKEERKRQTAQDKKDGLHGNKTAAREAVKSQVSDHRTRFVNTVAKTMGWKAEDLRFPEEKFANASPAAQEQAAKSHASKIFQAARAAVKQQRERLVNDAELRSQAGLGEVPLTGGAPDSLSVQDLSPVDGATKGLGFSPNYEKRAEAGGMTSADRADEVAASKPAPANPPEAGAPSAQERRAVTAKAVAEELKAIREPGPKLGADALPSAEQAVEMLKAEKALKAAEKAAKDHRKTIDSAKQAVEPAAFPIEVAGVAPDSDIVKDLEHDLRTLRTRSFLDEVGKVAGQSESIGRHIGVGAYNSVNALALAAGGASLIDRSVVDVLGIAGSAQVLARRLASDLTPAEIGHVQEAMQDFHVDHYMNLSDKALREAREWHEMAQEIELGDAANGADLAVAQEMNAKRREFTAAAEQVLGTALGEMEANAALVVALNRPKNDQVQVSLGRVSVESAITRARALGLQRGEYQVEKIGASTMLTVHGPGMDRLAQPVAKADLLRTQAAMDIIDGRHDEDDWLPAGVVRRPEAAMNVKPGAAPRLAKPFARGGDPARSIADYVGGRAADGDTAAEIMEGLLSEDTLQRSGNRAAYMAALNEVAPIADADGKMVRAEAHQATFDRMADEYAKREYGGALQPIHQQQFKVDQAAVTALHEALAAHPDGIAAFKPVGEMTSSDQRALRDVFAREYAKSDPAAEGLRATLDAMDKAEPAKDAIDMFGTEARNPDWTDWKAKRDEHAEKVNKATMTWSKYLDVMGSPANAYAAMQDVVRSKVLKAFADGHNRANPGGALKVGRTVIKNDLNHLDALDPVARDRRIKEHRDMVDRLRTRAAGRYAAGSVSDRLDDARAAEEASAQSQMGLFGTQELPSGDGDDDAATREPPPLKLGERYTIGHQAERQIAGMMPIVGKNFRPGQPTHLWSPNMSGKYVGRQRAVKLVRANRKVVLGLGVGSGKTAIALSSFTDLHSTGDAKRGLFVVPSVVQGQFHGEALTLLEPGKYNWHCDPGASREQRIAAYKDPKVDFNVVTHQAFRDDMLHMASARDGVSIDAVAEKLDAMGPQQKRDYMRDLMTAEGMNHDYLNVDEGHSLLNRQGKYNSRMANVLDGVGHASPTYVNMTADPVKNDPSEAFDLLAKMDPERYHDRDAFLRKYGVDTASSREGLQREMARHFYTGKIDPGTKAYKTEVPIKLGAEENAHLKSLDDAVAKARMARTAGRVDVDALRTLSPGSFEGVDPAHHEAVGEALNRSLAIVHNTAVKRAMTGKSKVDALSKIAAKHKGKAGIVFAHGLSDVTAAADRLKADGHRVVTLTGSDSSAEKDRKKREFQDGKYDAIVMSDAGAVGANLQKGKWLVQMDTPDTAMVHAQRNGRNHRIGQTEDVHQYDLVADHPAEKRARKRLEDKYELRGIMTSPLEGLDDRGIAGFLQRSKAEKQEQAEPAIAPPAAHEESDDRLGFKAAFATLKGGTVGADLHNKLWSKVQSGDTTELGRPSPLLVAAKAAREAGTLKTRADYDSFVAQYRSKPAEALTPAPDAQSEQPGLF